VGILAIESFVGQNIEEMAEFEKGKLAAQIKGFLLKYNERVESVETAGQVLLLPTAGAVTRAGLRSLPYMGAITAGIVADESGKLPATKTKMLLGSILTASFGVCGN